MADPKQLIKPKLFAFSGMLHPTTSVVYAHVQTLLARKGEKFFFVTPPQTEFDLSHWIEKGTSIVYPASADNTLKNASTFPLAAMFDELGKYAQLYLAIIEQELKYGHVVVDSFAEWTAYARYAFKDPRLKPLFSKIMTELHDNFGFRQPDHIFYFDVSVSMMLEDFRRVSSTSDEDVEKKRREFEMLAEGYKRKAEGNKQKCTIISVCESDNPISLAEQVEEVMGLVMADKLTSSTL